MPILGIGSTVWQFDPNRRVYDKEKGGGPIYREHFRAHTIIGETSRSWICGKYKDALKFDKKTLVPQKNFGGARYPVFTSQQQVDDAVYVHDNRRRISDLILNCNRASVLQHIEQCLLGHREELFSE